MTLLRHFHYAKATAARNMAFDAAMLTCGRSKDLVLWRFYGWAEPAVTFGYSQHWKWVRQQLGSFNGICIRRLTGGGIVDHRKDMTYSLVIPAAHPLYRQPALDIYQSLHEGIAGILTQSGIQAGLAPCPGPCGNPDLVKSGVCFQSPEPYDVVDPESGVKIAGAAMKRNKEGVLIQGSLSPTGANFPGSDSLSLKFGNFLENWLDTGSTKAAEPPPEAMVSKEEIRFSSEEWNLRR